MPPHQNSNLLKRANSAPRLTKSPTLATYCRLARNSEFGYIFIYFFSSLFLLLVLAQFFIAILVGAWEAAAQLKQKQSKLNRLPPGFKRALNARPWWKKAAHLAFFAMTGYSWDAGASASSIKHALRHAVSTLEFKIKKRRAEADNPYALGGAAKLTEEEQNEMFLFDNGLVVRKYVKGKVSRLSARTPGQPRSARSYSHAFPGAHAGEQLLDAGLRESTVEFLLDMFDAPAAMQLGEDGADDENLVADVLI